MRAGWVTFRATRADDDPHYNLGVFGYRPKAKLECFRVWGPNTGSAFTYHGSLQEVSLSDEHFVSKELGHDRIWEALEKGSPSRLDRRILTAVDWIGRGHHDPDPTDAFVQYMFAIEALLTHSEKGVLISPSIASQVAETAAFVLADGVQHRLETEKQMKRLYSARSGVVHGGKSGVSTTQSLGALYLAKTLTRRLLTGEDFRDLHTVQDLHAWAKRKKYT